AGSLRAHVFLVCPLPAYAIGALWLGLGFAWAVQRYARRPSHAALAGATLLALIFAVGARINLLAADDWGARYAQTVLKLLPKNAVVITLGDPDLAPIAYFHMIENWRPDITLYEPKGLILGNRLFHPLRTDEDTVQRILHQMIDAQTVPVVFTLDTYPRYAQRDHWLFVEVDKSSTDPGEVSVDVGVLDKARDAMPSDVPKEHLSRFFYIRGVLRANLRDNPGAARDLETAVSVWPAPGNPAFKELEDHYRRTGDEGAANAVEQRVRQRKNR